MRLHIQVRSRKVEEDTCWSELRVSAEATRTQLCPYFIFTYPAVRLSRFSITTYPAVLLLFFYALTRLCAYPAFRLPLNPAVPLLFFYALTLLCPYYISSHSLLCPYPAFRLS